jgi:hypothetical protein
MKAYLLDYWNHYQVARTNDAGREAFRAIAGAQKPKARHDDGQHSVAWQQTVNLPRLATPNIGQHQIVGCHLPLT